MTATQAHTIMVDKYLHSTTTTMTQVHIIVIFTCINTLFCDSYLHSTKTTMTLAHFVVIQILPTQYKDYNDAGTLCCDSYLHSTKTTITLAQFVEIHTCTVKRRQ